MANALTNDMTVGSPIKHIIKFTIPLLIGNIFQVLYNMVDTIIVGRTISVEALAAVGAAGAITFLIVGFALGFTNGLSIIVAQRFGANDMDGVRRSVGTGLILAAMASVVLTAVSMLSARSLLQFMHTPDNIINDSYNYIIVIYAGIVFQVFYNYISCVIRALGDSRTPLYFLLISSIINIILDLVFILNFHMGVAGAGLAT
ncbi:MAG: MATE family efflux transporter, partial [Monoglobus pectinilyticus]